MARYLVTGGCGFIGSHLVETLAASGHDITVLDNASSGDIANLPKNTQWVKGDVSRYSTVQECFDNIDGCFHLAAIASVEQSTKEWTYAHQVNSTATINVFQAASRLKKPVPVIYASSAAVYGSCHEFPLSEDAEPHPLSAYGIDKFSCEMHAHVADLIHHVPNTGFRFFNVYGPRQNPHSPYSGVISIFLDKILHHKDITIYGDGEQTRDFVFVDDVVKALHAGMQQLETTPAGHDVFNVCTGKAISVNHLAETIEKITGHHVKHVHLPPRSGDARTSIGNPKKLEKILHVRPTTQLDRGLLEVLNYFTKQERQDFGKA